MTARVSPTKSPLKSRGPKNPDAQENRRPGSKMNGPKMSKNQRSECLSFETAGGAKITLAHVKPKLDIHKEIQQDPDEIINQLFTTKRKKRSESQSVKKPKHSLSTEGSSIYSTSSEHQTSICHLEDEELDWSDCDELEISRVLDQSIDQSMNACLNRSLNSSINERND